MLNHIATIVGLLIVAVIMASSIGTDIRAWLDKQDWEE